MAITNKAKRKATEEASRTMLSALLQSQQSGELVEMARHFFSLVGGPQGFAKELYREFTASKKGGLVRFKILDLVLQCQRFITPKDSLKEELGLLDEKDLERIYREEMKHVKTIRGEKRVQEPANAADARGTEGEGSGPGPAAAEDIDGSAARGTTP